MDPFAVAAEVASVVVEPWPAAPLGTPPSATDDLKGSGRRSNFLMPADRNGDHQEGAKLSPSGNFLGRILRGREPVEVQEVREG